MCAAQCASRSRRSAARPVPSSAAVFPDQGLHHGPFAQINRWLAPDTVGQDGVERDAPHAQVVIQPIGAFDRFAKDMAVHIVEAVDEVWGCPLHGVEDAHPLEGLKGRGAKEMRGEGVAGKARPFQNQHALPGLAQQSAQDCPGYSRAHNDDVVAHVQPLS